MKDVAALAEAVELLGADLVANGRRIDEQNKLLAKQNEALAEFVPKGRFRWALAVVGVVIALAIAIVVLVRAQDRADVRRRDREAKAAEVADRDQRYAGCLRGNDLRATLRGAIDRAYTPTPIPPGLPPELAELYAQSQARAAAQRQAQLSDPGVQSVDCDEAYPPLPEK